MKNFNLYFKLKHFDVLHSTNDFASDLLRSENPDEGTVILADFQTNGKGQKNAVWISDSGSNLTFSIILFPVFLNPSKNFYISMTLSLGIVDLLGKFGLTAGIKWPNDIFTAKGKIAGILIENAIQGNKIKHSILGTGLNVNQKIFPEDIPNPTSMRLELKQNLDTTLVLRQLLESIEYWFQKLYLQEFSLLKSSYEERLLYLNERKKYLAGDDFFSGTIKGINESGQLLIEDEQHNLRSFSFKEVIFNF